MRNFILSCESTTDLSYSYLNEREIAVIPYTYIIHEHVYEDNMERNPDLMPKYYKMLEKGLLPTTSQINEASYYDFFEGLIQNGDVLHITFSSALSGSANNAYRAAAAIKKNYPGKQLQVIDSLCGAGGYGLLTDYVADMRDEGLSLATAADWIMKHRTCIHHQFFTTDLTFLHHSGRISGAASHIASILNIHPLIRLDQILDVESAAQDQESLTVVIVKKGDKQAGLVVDNLIGHGILRRKRDRLQWKMLHLPCCLPRACLSVKELRATDISECHPSGTHLKCRYNYRIPLRSRRCRTVLSRARTPVLI